MIATYNIINTIIYVFLAYFYIDVFLTKKNTRTSIKTAVIIIWCLIEILVVNFADEFFIVKACAGISLTILAGIILFKDQKYKIVIVAITHYTLALIIDFFSYMVAIQFTGYIHLFIIDQSIAFIYGGTISQLFYLIAIIAISFVFRSKEYKQIRIVEFLKFSIFPAVSISLIFLFVYYSSNRELSTMDINYYTCLSLCFVITNLYMFWLMKIDIDNKISLERNNARNEYAAELKLLYNQIKDEHQQLASIEHEYKNFISVLNYLISNRDFSKIEEYINNSSLAPTYTDIVNTGNAIISAVINAKYAEASRKGIQVRLDLDSLDTITIKDTDLIIILSNLFNNAIEACDACKINKLIEINIKNLNDYIFITFSNSIDSTNSESMIPAPKKDKGFLHGHGLKNVSYIINSYDGQMEISNRNNTFSVKIAIPNP